MVELPPVTYLQELYDKCRDTYFREGRAFLIPSSDEVTIEWSSRLTSSAGVCYPKQRVIRLSSHYHRTHPQDIESTLLHEMIHLLVSGHGPKFHAWVERIRQRGGLVERYSRARATAAQPPRWKYRCRRCGAEWFRYRRLRKGGRDYMHKGCGGRLQEHPLS